MRILVSWLREFVDVPDPPSEIARTMSTRGFAVEGIDPVGRDDAVLDFEITANRPDCLSVVGMAREVATAYGLPLRASGDEREPSAQTSLRDPLSAIHHPSTIHHPPSTTHLDVIIENPELCPRYVGVVCDVKVGSSPDWMQTRLQVAGVRPINNIVDVTNYVLLELGQPMHAFDHATLAGAEIRVRTARPHETLRTLDGQMRELSPEMLVIADRQRAVAVAGVMGGADSEVTARSSAIVFESAYFNPLSVRRTSRTLGLKTEASIRFERGGDPELPPAAMRRACELIATIGAGTARDTGVDRYPVPLTPITLRLRRSRVANLLGAAIPDADLRRILENLGFELRDDPDGWQVMTPTRRVDIAREVDLIEEVARHYGFDRLPTTFPALTSPPVAVDPRISRARHLRHILTSAGFSEAVTFGFIAKPAAEAFAPEDDLVPIANPLSETFAVLRPSVLPGLLDAVAHNRRRERRDVRLFEMGARFSRRDGESRAVACVWTGAAAGAHWSGGPRDVDFFDMKGVVERLCDASAIDARAVTHAEPWLLDGRAAALVTNGTRIGVLGQLAPSVAERHGLPGGDAVYVAEVDLDAAERAARPSTLRVEPLPRYPSVNRDISIVIDEVLPAAQVRNTIRSVAPDTLVRIREFDRYQGTGVPEGKVSLSLRLTFRSPDRTLTDGDVQAAMDALLAALRARHDAVQR